MPRHPLVAQLQSQWWRLWTEATLPCGSHATALLRSLAAAAVALLLVVLHAATRILQPFAKMEEWLSLATACLVLLLAARVAAAIQRWRLGNSDLHELVEAARCVVSTACAFLASSPELLTREIQFIADMKRLMLAYVALALQDCRQVDVLPRSQLSRLLDDAEVAALVASASNKPRAAVIEMWTRCRVNQVCFDAAPLLIPHAVQAIELLRLISVLPMLYQNVLNACANPPQWRYFTRQSPLVILSFLVFYALVRAATMRFYAALWVFTWGLALFGLDVLASRVETGNIQIHNDSDHDHLEDRLLHTQQEIDAACSEYFRLRGGEGLWHRTSRSVEPARRTQRPHPPVRWPRSIAPASPRQSPSYGGPGSPVSDSGGVTKPSLKHMLDMITGAAPAMQTARDAAERSPLLGTTPVARYDLFLQAEEARTEDGDSDATDLDEDERYQDLADSPA